MLAPAQAQQSSKTSTSSDSIGLSIYSEVERWDGQRSTRIVSWLTNSSRQFRTRFVSMDTCRILGTAAHLGQLVFLQFHCRPRGWKAGRGTWRSQGEFQGQGACVFSQSRRKPRGVSAVLHYHPRTDIS